MGRFRDGSFRRQNTRSPDNSDSAQPHAGGPVAAKRMVNLTSNRVPGGVLPRLSTARRGLLYEPRHGELVDAAAGVAAQAEAANEGCEVGPTLAEP